MYKSSTTPTPKRGTKRAAKKKITARKKSSNRAAPVSKRTQSPKQATSASKPTKTTKQTAPAKKRDTSSGKAKRGKAATSDKVGGVSSASVAKATGRTWPQWLGELDRAGAHVMEHKQIARLLHDEFGLSGWWSQMVTVGYEQQRLGRKKHEKRGSFEVSASKTISVPLSRLYRAWSDKRIRSKWLSESNFEVRTSTKDKSMRITWVDGRTHVDANFVSKGASKSQIAVQHKKLADASSADRCKKQWAERLASLKKLLDS